MTEPIRKSLTVPLRPADAFRLFTEGIDGWWPGAGRAGPGSLRLRPEGLDQGGRPWATVTAWEPGRRLAMTWHHGHEDGEEPSEVAVTFTPVDAGTRIDLAHAAPAPPAARAWTASLGRLAQAAAWASAGATGKAMATR